MATQPITQKSSRKDSNPRFSKRIEDLIDDAEIEAEIEIEKRIRYKNTKIAFISLVGLGLMFVLYKGIEDKTDILGTLSKNVGNRITGNGVDMSQPIPFPLMSQSPLNPDLEPPAQHEQLAGGPGADVAGFGRLSSNEMASPVASEDFASSLTTEEPQFVDAGQPMTALTPQPLSKEKPEPELSAADKAAKMISEALAPAREIESTKPVDPVVEKAPAPVAPKGVKQVKEAKAPLATTPSSSSNYIIQLGAFSVKSNADRLAKKLTSKGWTPYIDTRGNNGLKHVVFIGGFSDPRNGNSLLQDLKSKGLKPFMTKNEDGTHSIILGKSDSRAGAEAIQTKLTQQGILSNIKEMKMDTRIYLVRVGGFADSKAANQEKKRLSSLGFKQTLVVASPKNG